MKILLVDDEAFALRLVGRQLKKLGFTDVVAHQHAAEALALIEGDLSAADVILLDLQMPDIDGIEFVRHLARLQFTGGLILISGEDERVLQTASGLARAHSLDVLGAIHKPVTPPQLEALLRAPLHRAGDARTARKSYAAETLQQAIASGHLVNHYQPKVELATGRLIGVETLVRWEHVEDGLVFPDQFITCAEDNNLIDELTRAVLLEALRQARVWADAGLSLHVGVNVSMDNLAALDFPDFVANATRAAGVPSRNLVLEVTESRLMTNVLATLDILTRLRLKYVGLSIDDFGTGHSSLAQLRNIPFDELKIDRGFVHGAAFDKASAAIVEGSLNMAHQLGMKAVAEGVEDRSDWDLLQALGCDYAQGYFISRPLAPAAFETWRHAWEQRRADLARA